MKKKMLAVFQICISVPLKGVNLIKQIKSIIISNQFHNQINLNIDYD